MIKVGGTEITDVMLGSTQVNQVYIGSNLVWEKNSPVSPYDAQVEYLQSSGTQYIDTDYIPTGLTLVEFEGKSAASPVTGTEFSNPIFGVFNAETSTSTNKYNAIFYTPASPNSTQKNRRLYFYNHYSSSNNAFPAYYTVNLTDITSFRTYIMNKGDVWKNGTKLSASATNNYASPSLLSPMYIFARNYTSGNTQYGKVVIKWFKIYDGNGVLVRDYIPVRKNSIGYFYDRVNGVLYGNAGTGSFTYGNDIPSTYDSEIEYIEGTGTQWIDTKIRSVIGDSITIKLSTNGFGASFLCGSRASSSGMANSFFIYGDVSSNVAFAANSTYTSSNTNVQDGNIHTIKHDINGGYIDNVQKVNVVMTENPSMRPYAIFTVNDRDTPTNISSCKLYGFTYKRGGTVIMDLIPVRKNGVGYMYDKVSHILLGNVGTGSFTLGPDVT